MADIITGYQHLFGNQDSCACDDCRSALGPAAYFVDLLANLGDPTASASPMGVLTAPGRRPDLLYTDLSCDNTDTPLPYIDLSCEILEAAIAGPFTITGSVPQITASLVAKKATGLEGAFAAEGFLLTAAATASAVSGGWIVRDTGVVARIDPVSGNLSVIAVPQTSESAEDLRANPQHVRLSVYRAAPTLAAPATAADQAAVNRKSVVSGTRGFTLPFSLGLAEARVFLQSTSVSRSDLMTAFGAADDAIAIEDLGLSSDAWSVLTGATPRTADDVWLEPFPTTPLSVADFLKRTGMTYDELTAVLATRFVNGGPGALVGIYFADGPDPCNLATATIGPSAGAALPADAFDRIRRFTLSMRQIGWSARTLDVVMTGLASALTASFGLAFGLAQIKRWMDQYDVSAEELVSLWGVLDADGDDSLYSRTFLDSAVYRPVDTALAVDLNGSTFELELASAATKTTATAADVAAAQIVAHEPALLAGLRITSADVEAIRAAGLLVITNSVDLTLANITTLYRVGLLSRMLSMPVADLLTLRRLSRIEPFGASALGTTRDFIALAEKVSNSSFNLGQLAYLVADDATSATSGAPSVDAATSLAFSLRTGIANIRLGTAPVVNPSIDIVRAKLGNLLKGDTADRVAAMLNDAVTFVSDVGPTALTDAFIASFAAKIAADDSLVGRVVYDADANQLQFDGIMTDAQLTALQAGVPPAFQTAAQDLHDQPRDFFKNANLDFLTGSAAPPSVIDDLFAPGVSVADRTSQFLALLLPFMEKLLTDRFVKQSLSTALPLGVAVVDILASGRLASDFASLGSATDVPASDALGAVTTGWAGRIVAPFSERFTLHIDATADGVVHLTVDEKDLPVSAVTAGSTTAISVNWVAGQYHDLAITFTPTPPAAGSPPPATPPSIRLSWSSPSTPRETIPNDALIDTASLNVLQGSLARFAKAAAIVSGFGLTAKEVQYIGDHGADFGETTPSTPATLFLAWSRLADLVAFRRTLHASSSELVDVFAAPTAAQSNLVVALTGWDPAVLADLLASFGAALPPLTTEIPFLRLKACFKALTALGVKAATASNWANAEPTLEDAQDIKNAVKAKHADADWPAVSGQLSDQVRKAKRAALVAHILANDVRFKDLGTNALFDHFLIDVEIECCMDTSRIKQAIGSVQVFVQRCLMHLQDKAVPAIEPTLTDPIATDWNKWMKSYRVWEANRQIFLYPENWIEPELRDDKTPFFVDLENELMQGDVTSDTVETAFRHYLEKLDEVARLSVAGFCVEDIPASNGDSAKTLLHILGRTPSEPHKYFYRTRLTTGDATSLKPSGTDIDPTTSTPSAVKAPPTTWSPWEKVDVDIQGDHLVVVIWHRRVYLFWPTFAAKQEDPSNTNSPKYLEVQLTWTHYQEGKWAPRSISTSARSLRFYEQKPEPAVGPPNPADEAFPYVTHDPPQTDPAADTWAYAFRAVFIDAPGDPSGSRQELNIQCFRAAQHGGAKPAVGTLMGSFAFSDCRGDVSAGGMTFLTSTLLTPKRSIMVGEALVDGVANPAKAPAVGGTLAVRDNRASVSSQVNDYAALNLFDSKGKEHVVLGSAVPHRVPFRTNQLQFLSDGPFFYEDAQRAFLVTPSAGVDLRVEYGNALYLEYGVRAEERLGAKALAVAQPQQQQQQQQVTKQAQVESPFRSSSRYTFDVFYHPYVCDALGFLNRDGIDAMFAWPMNDMATPGVLPSFVKDFFQKRYKADTYGLVTKPYPKEDLDLATEGSTAYSQYNWELFFHAPLMVATRLAQNQQFDDALRWFGYLFDPTANNDYAQDPAKYWRFRRFFEETGNTPPQTINDILADVGSLTNAINAWMANPFQPHLVARTRIGAYQKTVVMKYIDTLLAYADQLFRRETLEALNEATLLYVLASEILGDRPVTIPQPFTTSDKTTYAEIVASGGFDQFGEADVEALEDLVAAPSGAGVLSSGWNVVTSSAATAKLFCIPPNDTLLGYWDLVADRLFKLRNCLNIEGIAQKLPLFEPPIDPALLVRAAAAGVNLDTVLNDLSSPLPAYRFTPMLQKAVELTNEVRGFGSLLLSALEKRDAEAIALLRAGNERDLLTLIRDVKQKQVDEAAATLQSLQNYLLVVKARQTYYSTRDAISAAEDAQLALMAVSAVLSTVQIGLEFAAGAVHPVPEVDAGLCAGATTGGNHIANGIQAFAAALGIGAGATSTVASTVGTVASFQRRKDDWDFQADLATKEIDQVNQQIAAADLRHQIAQTELDNHNAQIDQSETVFETLRDQFTNVDLHQWMAGQVSTVYFQAYQLAYDLARRAERAFQYELADYDASFIEFGDWDGLRKGLLAGERLVFALRRMEAAYLDENRREYEITKHVSLLETDPLALLRLRETGQCFLNLTEDLYDADFPGHYMRRIKSLSLTIPCVTGPYRGVNATVTLLGNSVRVKSDAPVGGATTPAYPRKDQSKPDARFRDNVGAVQSIATSTAQNDSGLFELSFRDERFLPFEGAGAISSWQIYLDPASNRFDFDTISDVVLHVRYTARDGGVPLQKAASTALGTFTQKATTTPLTYLLSARRDIGDEWERFVHPPAPAVQALELNLDALMPYQPKGATPTITDIHIFLKTPGVAGAALVSPGVTLVVEDPASTVTPPPALGTATLSETLDPLGHVIHGAFTLSATKLPSRLRLRVTGPTMPISADALDDLFIALKYTR